MSTKWLKIFIYFFNFQKGFTPAAPVHTNREDAATQANLGFIHAFVAAISVIIVSELGDKTFFIAAIMAMRYNRLTVLAGAMLALALMTCLSGKAALLGAQWIKGKHMCGLSHLPSYIGNCLSPEVIKRQMVSVYYIKTQILLRWSFYSEPVPNTHS